MDKKLDISVVVPLYNEAESLPELVAWIDRVANSEGLSYEIIMIDDGSTDGSWAVVQQLKERYGTRIDDRLREMFDRILFQGKSYRK